MKFGVLVARLGFIAACVITVKFSGLGAHPAAPRQPPADLEHVSQQMRALDIPFVANAGELDSRVALYARTAAGTLYVERDGELTYELADGTRSRHWALKERLVDSSARAVTGREAATVRVNRFSAGAAPGTAHSRAAYRWADLGEAWPGIKVEVHASARRAEKFFHVAAGADPAQIQVRVEGSEQLTVNGRGELEASTGIGNAVFSAPVAWQDIDGHRRNVPVRYALIGRDRYGFALSAYDAGREVIIDPLLQSTYLGGSGGEGDDRVTGLAIEQTSGDVYAVGQVTSLNGFPVSAGALQTTFNSEEAFIARLPADLKSFTEVTYLGGGSLNEGQAIAISPANGDIYVAGHTDTNIFPGITGGAVTDCVGSGTDTCQTAFVSRLDPTLATLRQSTLYGDSIAYQPSGPGLLKLVINAAGDVYLAGSTTSNTLQGTTGGAIASEPGTNGNGNGFGFIARFAADLKTVVQATYIAGSSLDTSNRPAGTYVNAIALDPTNGDVIVAGLSTSATLPITPGAFMPTRDPSSFDTTTNPGYVARLPGTLTSFKALSWVVFARTDLFGSTTLPQGLALHPTNGDIYVSGLTDANELPGPTGGFLTTFKLSSNDAEFIIRIAPDLSAVHNATYIAVASPQGNLGIRIPDSGDVFSAGAACPDTTNGIQAVASSSGNLCVSRFTPDLHSLVQATFLGGSGDDHAVNFLPGNIGAAMEIRDSNGDVYLGGGTTSTDFPGTAGGAQPATPANNVLPNNVTPIYGYIARVTADLTGTPQPGTLQFSAATYTAADTAGTASILVNRSGGSAGAVSVTFTTSDGTGKAGTDYTTTTQVVSFADGDNAQKSITISVKPDGAVIGNKTVNLTLSNATGGAFLGAQSSAVLTITQATPPAAGSLQFSAASYVIADNAGNATVGVTRTGGSAGAVSVTFATSDGTGKSGTNYTTTNQTVSFADGDTAAKSVSIPVEVAGTLGNSFTVNLTLTAATGGATLGAPTTAALTINATTPVIAPPPVSDSVTVTGNGGGGALGTCQILILGLLVLLQVIRKNSARKSFEASGPWCVTMLCGTLGFAPHANADAPDFYAGFGLGQARSVATSSDLERKLAAAGFPDAAVALDDHKFAGKLYAGASFNKYFGVELAYVGVNKVRTHTTAVTTDAAAFVAAVTAIHPYSARGGTLTAMASLPLLGGLSLFARGGGIAWHGEIDADVPGIDADSTKKTGVSGVLGGGVEYSFSRRLAVRAEWERYFITRDSMDLAAVGLRVRF